MPLQEEWTNMVGYGKQYLNLVQVDYKVIQWKLFNAVDAKGWTNVLAIIELLFCLSMANGWLERVFSQIKNDRRTSLKENTLTGCSESTWKTPHSQIGMQVALFSYG